ncbi:MAG: carbonic anhydrase [Patescibacteria group bacterium]
MSHNCKNLLIRCMDFRLRGELMKWVDESGLFEGGFDVISLAGASKSLADGSYEIKDFFLQQVSVSTDLHRASRVVIFHHSDCGAYAKENVFASKEEEKFRQVEDMEKSREILKEKYPDLEVILVWGDLQDEHGDEINFEILER